MGTATQVLAALEAYELRGKDGKYSCNSPLRVGSNSHAFGLVIEEEEKGAFIDRVTGETGSLFDLAKILKIMPNWDRESMTNKREQAQITKRGYKGPEDYFEAHHAPAEAFKKAGWEYCTQFNRPALRFHTATGDRYRFLDDNIKFRFWHKSGYVSCFYGLDRVLRTISETGQPLIICNGEASVVVAQYYGLPATTVTSGERDKLSDDLLDQLREKFDPTHDDHEVVVAYDCDKAGREKGPALAEFLRSAGYKAKAVDLMLTDGGDLADFCGLHGKESAYADFCKLPEVSVDKPEDDAPKKSILVSWSDASARARSSYRQQRIGHAGSPAPIPFVGLSKFGGMAALLEPGNVMCIAAPTGHAKTSLMETICDFWRSERGLTGAMWGPEFPPETYVFRAVQRAGGPPSELVRWHDLYMKGLAATTPLNEDQIVLSESLIDRIDQWKGGMFLVDKMGLSISQVIDQYKRAQDNTDPRHPLAFVVLDYAQLVYGEKSTTSVEQNLALFKGFCVDNHVVGLVGSQITKSGSSGASSDGISLEDLRYANGDYFNCIITLCRQMDLDGKLLPVANVRVVKNSLGECGSSKLIIAPKSMRWGDPVIHNVNVEKATITQVPM